MALADTITSLGNSIIALVGTRAKKDLSNIDEAGVAKIKSYAGGGGSNPVGTVIAYMGTTVPDGYLLMDGREVSKETYADLYAVVGDTMGTATDSTKFVIANMTDGRYLMGSTVAGASVEAGMCNATGTFEANRFGTTNSGVFTITNSWGNGKHQSGGGCYGSVFSLDLSRANSIYGKSDTVTPLSLRCMFCIRY